MERNFLVESRTYDKLLRGSWYAHWLQQNIQLGDEQPNALDNCVRLWLPEGTPMKWASGTRPLRKNCLQFFWPQRWYMLSAFYEGNTLARTYANIIQPATITLDRIAYTDLDLSILFESDLNYEILTQAEFEDAAQKLRYDEETRVSALMALQTLTSAIQRSIGVLSAVPHRLDLTRLHTLVNNN